MGFARFISSPYLVIGWLSIAAVSVAAQEELSGTVVDESGSALPRVAVKLVDQETSRLRRLSPTHAARSVFRARVTGVR
jgi:hypothetical protein